MKRTYTAFEKNSKDLVTKWYPHWTAKVRDKIPGVMDLSDKDIYSEITHHCLYLSSIFKGGCFAAYCNKFIVKRVVSEIWKEYKKLDHNLIADAYEDYEDGESHEEHHVIVGTSMRARSSEEQRHEKTEMITKLYQAALDLDKQTEGYYQYANIVDDMRMGMSLDDIAKEFGTYKMDISRRLKSLKDEVNKMKEI